MSIDYDLYGHCCLCHKNMLIEQAVGKELIKRFSAEYTETEFLLNDGSRMRVALCLDCKENLNEDQNNSIMECIIKGWGREIKDMVEDNSKPEWTQDRADKHMEIYSKKEIICNSEDQHQEYLTKKLEEYNGTDK